MTQTYASLVFGTRHGPLSAEDWERLSLALEVLSVDENAGTDAAPLVELLGRAYNVDTRASGLGDEFNDIARGLYNALLAMARRRITLCLRLNDTPEHVAAKIVEGFGAEYAHELTWAISKLLEPVDNGAKADEG